MQRDKADSWGIGTQTPRYVWIMRYSISGAIVVASSFAGAGFAMAQQSVTVTYEYDALGRLVIVEYGAAGSIDYGYDPNGNRTQVMTSTPGGSPPPPPPPPGSSLGYTVVQVGSVWVVIPTDDGGS